MFKKRDQILIAVICLLLGIFIVSQFYASGEFQKIIQPENNDVLAVEVSKLTKTNADLRTEVGKLTANLDAYRNTSESKKRLYSQYKSDLDRFNLITGASAKTGQGVIMNIEGSLTAAQVVDLVNAIKNIGSSLIEINGTRLTLATSLSAFANQPNYEVKIIGNGKLLKSAIERKGGILELISGSNIKISVSESDVIVIKSGNVLNFKYAEILSN